MRAQIVSEHATMPNEEWGLVGKVVFVTGAQCGR